MKGYFDLGPCPSAAICVQVNPDVNYGPAQRFECAVYIRQLQRVFPDLPDCVRFKITGSGHDFGTYYDVGVEYSGEDGLEKALEIERNTPDTWDEEAEKELASYDFTGITRR